MYDIVIVGAGPAGSTLARLIGDKYKLLLIDKRDLGNENHKNHINKCCGGLLAPDAQKMIAKLGLGIPKDILVDPQPFAVRAIDLTEKYISIQQWFECPCPMQYFTAIFDEEISDFYSWIIPKENYLLLGSALRPRENTWEKYNLLKTKLTQLGFDFDNRIKTEGAYIYRPKKISQFCAGRNGIALVGEAAGAISPSSAEGISYALKSSLYLARSLEDGIDGFLDRYKHGVKHIKLNLLIKNLKSPAMYNPFLRHLAMKSGLLSI